jgi:hypothetical protein
MTSISHDFHFLKALSYSNLYSRRTSELQSSLTSLSSSAPGFSEVITEEKAKAIGIREYVMKPVVKSQIANTIRQVLDEK